MGRRGNKANNSSDMNFINNSGAGASNNNVAGSGSGADASNNAAGKTGDEVGASGSNTHPATAGSSQASATQ